MLKVKLTKKQALALWGFISAEAEMATESMSATDSEAVDILITALREFISGPNHD